MTVWKRHSQGETANSQSNLIITCLISVFNKYAGIAYVTANLEKIGKLSKEKIESLEKSDKLLKKILKTLEDNQMTTRNAKEGHRD